MKKCAMPPRAKGAVPRFSELPEGMVGCRLTAHGNSTFRSEKGPKGRTALSMHASVASKTTLFNVAAPVIFKNAELKIDQRAGLEGAKRTDWQLVSWPRVTGCDTQDDCGPKERCRIPEGKPKPKKKGAKAGKCESFRRKKTPFAYVVGEVYPDDGVKRATPIALFPGRIEADGSWTPAKYFNPVTCKEADKASCPAVTRANTVRFVPNFADGSEKQPFSVTLDGVRRKKNRGRGKK